MNEERIELGGSFYIRDGIEKKLGISVDGILYQIVIDNETFNSLKRREGKKPR